jgi:Ribbon-helix-helix domain
MRLASKIFRASKNFCDTLSCSMAKNTFCVRLTDSQMAALKAIAERNGVEVSQLIRWGIDALIAHVERNGGRLLLPMEFGETFTSHQPQAQPENLLRAAEETQKYPAKRRTA